MLGVITIESSVITVVPIVKSVLASIVVPVIAPVSRVDDPLSMFPNPEVIEPESNAPVVTIDPPPTA